MLTRLHGSRLIDAGGESDPPRDLWWDGDRIVDPPAGGNPGAEFDASGCVTMAGGIDLHTHIGGGKVAIARMLMADQMPPWRDAARPFLPPAAETARRYLDMGFTTCLEPAVIPCNARAAHAEMADVTDIDTGGYVLLGNDATTLALIAADAPQEILNAHVAWMITATRCVGVKVVNPGGIDAFKFGVRALDVDTPHPTRGITPATIIRRLARAVHEIGLPHPLHVHCSNLGVPGNIASTLATIAAADGYPIHLAHVQFHCYGDGGPYGMSSAAGQLADAIRRHPNVTVDVGQIQFGRTVTISADTMHQFENRLYAKPRKSVMLDIECEAGCGVVPFRYRRREFVHALQWAIGLELFLLIDDPDRVFLTTDHPNGGPFTAYPHLLRLLGDKSFRDTALSAIHPEAAAASSLAGLDRAYSLHDVARMTRSAPATMLGLRDRGHLSPGAVADVVVYETQQDLEKMFAQPRYVFRRGRLIRDRGRMVSSDPMPQHTLAAELDIDDAALRHFPEPAHGVDRDRLWIDADEMPGVIGSAIRRVPPRDGVPG